jgi:hypothetical protein
MLGGLFILALKLLSTNYNRLVGNKWSISQESLYATIHSIVTNQINPKNGQMYFPFIYALFIFILINNLIGMVKRCLRILLLLFILNNLYYLYSFIPGSNPIGDMVNPSSVFRSSWGRGMGVPSKKNKLYSLYLRSFIHTRTSKNKPRYSFNNKNTFYLNPDYITGFVDGEGCFSISIFKDSRMLTGWAVKPIFSISLHNKDLNLLEAIQRTLNVGKIYKHGTDSIQYRVSSLRNIQVILEHFYQYPLLTKKQADYLLFKEAVNLIVNKEHLSSKGLLKLVSIKATLNWGLSEKFKESFPTVKPINRPLPSVESPNIKYFSWVQGFIEAEGCFQVILQKIKNRINVSLRFSITQDIRDEILLNNIVTYLNCGRYYKSPTRNEGQYLVTVFSDINEKIIPLLNEYPLKGVKKQDYLDFVQIAELIKSKDHLTEEGVEKIKLIQNNMNKRRILIK